MTLSTLHITVGDRDQLRDESLRVAREIDDAESPEEAESRDTHNGRSVLQFGSYDDLVTNLTPLRLVLLRAIREHEPESMREAARLVDRDVSDVHSDLTRLDVLGLIELEEDGPSGARRPIVPYERIEMHVEYPLVGADDQTDSATSAVDA